MKNRVLLPLAAALLAAVMVLLCACGDKAADVPSADDSADPPAASDPAADPAPADPAPSDNTDAPAPTPQPADPAAVYESVLENYRFLLSYDAAADTDGSLLAKNDVYSLWEGSELLMDHPALGYCLQDLDGDGTEELLVGTTDPDHDDRLLFSAFTLEGGAPVRLFVSWGRNCHYLSSLGTFYNTGSSGAAWSDYYIETLRGCALAVTEGVWTEETPDGGIAFRHTTDGGRSDANGTVISESEADGYLNEYEDSILPLPDLTPIF